MSLARRLAFPAAIAAAAMLSACERPADRNTGTDASGAGSVRYITIKGSDTMVNVCAGWAEKYMAAHKDTDISVTGGGSGTGVAALLNGTTDICASSRPMKDKEIADAKAKGIEPVKHVVGMDGLAVVVNPANPVSELSLDQIHDIYTGKLTNWKDVGGNDAKILVLSRENNSGTYVVFQEIGLRNEDFASTTRFMPSSASLTESVAQDKTAIGYTGEGYARAAKVKLLSVKPDAASPAVAPDEANVRDGSYPISRPLLLYTNGEPAGTIGDFITFIKSPEGQKVVTEKGYVAIKG